MHKMLVRTANMEDPDQTASSEAVWSVSALFARPFWQAAIVWNFRTFTVYFEVGAWSNWTNIEQTLNQMTDNIRFTDATYAKMQHYS